MRFSVAAEDGERAIFDMEVRAREDDFDFAGGTNGGNLLGRLLLQPTLDPYRLGRGQVAMNYTGIGRFYPIYNLVNFLSDSLTASNGLEKREEGVASLLANGGPEYFLDIAASPSIILQA